MSGEESVEGFVVEIFQERFFASPDYGIKP